MDLKLAGRAGLGAYDSALGLIAEAPCHALDGQGDVPDAPERRATPQPAHVPDVRRVNRSRALRRLPAGQAHRWLVRARRKLAAVVWQERRGIEHARAARRVRTRSGRMWPRAT